MRSLLYDSTSARSLISAAIYKNKYPYATAYDLAGKNTTQVGTVVSALATGQDGILVAVRNDYVLETLPTATQTVTAQGTDGDSVVLLVGDVPIARYVKVTADSTPTALAIKIAANINAGTAVHGFSTYPLIPTTAAVVIKAPAGSGVTYNSAVITKVISAGATMAITEANFTATGVDAVGALPSGSLTALQLVTVNAACTSGAATDVYDTVTLYSPRITWDTLYPTTNAPLIVQLAVALTLTAAYQIYLAIASEFIVGYMSALYNPIWEKLLSEQYQKEIFNTIIGYDFAVQLTI